MRRCYGLPLGGQKQPEPYIALECNLTIRKVLSEPAKKGSNKL